MSYGGGTRDISHLLSPRVWLVVFVAHSRHKHVRRTPFHRRLARVGVPLAAVLVLAAPSTAMVVSDLQKTDAEPMNVAPAIEVRPSPVPMRVAPISRSETRVRLEEKPPRATDHMFATAPLNVRTQPSDDGRVLEVLDPMQKVGVTGERKGPWSEVVMDEESRWVHTAYLSETKPTPEPEPTPEPSPTADPTPEAEPTQAPSADPTPAAGGLSTAACPSGSDVESGLASNAVAVHRAVCAAFPSVTSYGGVRPGDTGEHGTGHALDIMIPDSATGDEIAAWARANAGALGISEVIWSQHIWTVQRSSEGWRPMEDRGSATANHYDHVHVTVY